MNECNAFHLDPNKQALHFIGGCDKAIASCLAVCCRNWNVLVTVDEEASNRYTMETLCLSSNDPCENHKLSCFNKRKRLARKPDGSCLYLNDQNRCSIYETRPTVCRAFTCEGGWKLSPLGSPQAVDIQEPNLELRMTRERMRDDLVFLQNPAVSLKTLFYSKEDKTVIFVVKRVDKCGIASAKATLDNPNVNDDMLCSILNAFDGNKDCETILREVNDRFKVNLTTGVFLDIVLLFLSESLLMPSMSPSLRS